MREPLLEGQVSSIEKPAIQAVSPETYGERLRVFRAGLIILTAGTAGLGSIIAFAPMISELPFPVGLVIPAASGILGLSVGAVFGEVLFIAAAKLTTRSRG